AVGEGEPLLVRAGEVRDQRRAVSTGLLVLELTGHERRHVDLVHERHRIERVGDRWVVVVVGAYLRVQVGGLAVESLVRSTHRVAALDLLPRVRLTALRSRGPRV